MTLRTVHIGAVVAAIGWGCARTQAVLLDYGDSATLTGTTLAERPLLGGSIAVSNTFTVLHSTDSGPFRARLEFGVVREDTGDLDFTYRVLGSETDTPLRWKVSVENLPFRPVDTDVLLDSPGTTVPISVVRNSSGVTTFSSSVALQPGQSTHTFLIHLEGVRDFSQSGGITLTTDFGREPDPPGAASPNGTFGAEGYAPVPEPQSLGLLALAVGALVARSRLRRWDLSVQGAERRTGFKGNS